MELNANQKKVVNTLKGNISVIASAGSGKTSVLTLRIKNLADNKVKPSSILAVTFSKKAKETLIKRLRDLLPDVYEQLQIETFHSFALKIIRKVHPEYRLWNLQWEKEKILKQITYDMRLYSGRNFPYNEIMSFISTQKNLMIKPGGELQAAYKMPYSLPDMREVYLRYENYKADNKLIEFDDFLNTAVDILKSDTHVLEYYKESIKYILADEYQDISISQAVLLKMLNTDNTMIVGDPLQAIYSFRGGDSRFILNFDKDYPNVTVIHLNTNYRCGKDIVALANTFAHSVPDSEHHNYVESLPSKDSVPIPTVKHYLSDSQEAESISEKILDKNYNYSDVAILARTNAQLQKIQNSLSLNNIPFEVVGGSLFINQKEIKILVSYLLLAYNTDNDEAFEYIWNRPNRYLPNVFLEKISEYGMKNKISMYDASLILAKENRRYYDSVKEIHDIIGILRSEKFDNVREMIEFLRDELDIDYFVSKGEVGDDGKSLEQSENMDSFENICEAYKNLNQFNSYIERLNKPKEMSNKNKVRLLTLHKSKGLEFPVVFIIGCNEGLLPHGKADNIDDERRLMYVGITRAEKELYMSYVSKYNNTILSRSRFIYEFQNAALTIK